MSVSSDSLQLAVIEEVTQGITPPSPTFDLFRTTGEGLTYDIVTVQSDEMGGINRGVKDNILTGAAVTGNIEFELSKFAAFEMLYSAGLGNDWSSDPLSVPGDDADRVYDYDILRSFTVEKRFTLDSTPTYNFHRFLGLAVDVTNLSITPKERITGSFEFSGLEMVTGTATLAGATYNMAGTSPIMAAPLVTGLTLLSPHGIDDTTGDPLGTPVSWLDNSCFMGLDITLTNNIRALDCIGQLKANETVLGRFEASATGSLYYNGNEPLDEGLIQQSEYALMVTMTDSDGGSYEVLFPRAKFNSATALASGTNTDVMTEIGLSLLEYQGDDYALTLITTRDSPA